MGPRPSDLRRDGGARGARPGRDAAGWRAGARRLAGGCAICHSDASPLELVTRVEGVCWREARPRAGSVVFVPAFTTEGSGNEAWRAPMLACARARGMDAYVVRRPSRAPLHLWPRSEAQDRNAVRLATLAAVACGASLLGGPRLFLGGGVVGDVFCGGLIAPGYAGARGRLRGRARGVDGRAEPSSRLRPHGLRRAGRGPRGAPHAPRAPGRWSARIVSPSGGPRGHRRLRGGGA
jgi:hypothetical protein